MKPLVTKVKNLRGRITAYRATLGAVSCEAPTADVASVACEKSAVDALARLDDGARFCRWQGHVYAVVPTLDGWGYWLDSFSSQHAQLGYATRELATRAAVHHLAQNAWTVETDDAAFCAAIQFEDVREQISSWIRFQRDFLRLRAEGKTDEECHRLACLGSVS